MPNVDFVHNNIFNRTFTAILPLLGAYIVTFAFGRSVISDWNNKNYLFNN